MSDSTVSDSPQTPSSAGVPTDQPDNLAAGGSVPNQHSGAGIGAGSEPTTFEPEEDPEAVEDPAGK